MRVHLKRPEEDFGYAMLALSANISLELESLTHPGAVLYPVSPSDPPASASLALGLQTCCAFPHGF